MIDIKEEEILKAIDKAYKKAGHNAYFANGFRAGLEFAIEQVNKDTANFSPSHKYYDTHVVVDGNIYRIGFDSMYLSLQNNRTTGWVLWNNYPPNPKQLGSEFENKEFKIFMKGVLIYSNVV